MKWQELSAFHKLVLVIGYICIVIHFVLSGLRIWADLTISRVLEHTLVGVFFLCESLIWWKRSKWAMGLFALALGYGMFALYVFFA